MNGNPENSGISTGYGFFAPRIGFDYRLTEKTVVRSGFGLTADPDSMRYLRDEFPEDLTPNYSGTGTAYHRGRSRTPALTQAASRCLSPTAVFGLHCPNCVPAFGDRCWFPGSTTTVAQNFRRGYIESWNLFIQRDLGHSFVANVGYVGTHFVRQQVGVSLNAAPFPSATSTCMANGQYSPSSGLSGSCSFQSNTIINQMHCGASSVGGYACYNTGGITMSEPLFSSSYNALQSQLTHNAGKNASMGAVYTWSHAIDYEDNGAGSGAEGTKFNYPSMFRMNKGTAGYDQKHNVQIWGIYTLPFGYGQAMANHGLLAQIIGGFSLNGNFFHVSGFPFGVSANSNVIGNVAPGFGTTFAQLNGAYQQQSGHNRTFGNASISGGKPWFNPANFSTPNEPAATVAGNPTNAGPTLPNTGRNSFRGPGVSMFNASLFRAFHIYHESEFQIRFEAFNLFNHAWLNNPNTTVPSAANIAAGNYGTFGLITSYGPPYSPTQGARQLQFSGRINF